MNKKIQALKDCVMQEMIDIEKDYTVSDWENLEVDKMDSVEAHTCGCYETLKRINDSMNNIQMKEELEKAKKRDKKRKQNK